MKDTILSILNENSAELTVEKSMKIAEILVEPLVKGTVSYKTYNTFHQLLQSFESFKKIRLEKGQFVCEVEEPEFFDESVDYQTQKHSYELALQKVIFEGFESEKSNSHILILRSGKTVVKIFQGNNGMSVSINGEYFLPVDPIIADLYHAIEVYNRTAKEPIQLKFTENILPLLGVKI